MARLKDVEMRIDNDWWEYSKTIGSDLRMCEDNYAIWQALEGELKTQQGSVRGIGLENYGSRLYTLLGENFSVYTPQEAETMVKEVSARYRDILDTKVSTDQIAWDQGLFKCKIIITTNFGEIMQVFTNQGEC